MLWKMKQVNGNENRSILETSNNEIEMDENPIQEKSTKIPSLEELKELEGAF